MSIDLRHGNALDLYEFEDNSFDIVLLCGPLYHLEYEVDRQTCIKEAMRVCKRDGTTFITFFINNMVILTEFDYRPNFFKEDTYDHNTFKVQDFSFVFFTIFKISFLLL